MNAQVEVVHDEWVYDLNCDQSFYKSCIGEFLNGYLVYNVITRYDEDDHIVGWHFNVKKGKVTGCETGREFIVVDYENDVYHFNPNNPNYAHNVLYNFQLIGKKGEKYKIRVKLHITVDANGEIKVYIRDWDWCEPL
jgi:hypothetical protein